MRVLLWLLLFGVKFVFANMASPYISGTSGAAPFSSKQVIVQKENLYITLSADFKTAFYIAEYHIYTDTDGLQMPLLFYAQQYSGGFRVTVDNQPIELLSTPTEQIADNFQIGKNDSVRKQSTQEVAIRWDQDNYNYYPLSDLKYFEVDLTKGTHVIQVSYAATASVDRSDWVNNYTHHYSLSPARYWKHFGQLSVQIVDSQYNKRTYFTNLGKPDQKAGTAGWSFVELPADYITIQYKPIVSGIAKQLVAIGPGGLTLIFGAMLVFLHLLLLRYNLLDNAGINLTLWLGGFLVPFVVLLFYTLCFPMIDAAIGLAASGRHGYSFLVFIIYPVAVPFYVLVCWVWVKMWVKPNAKITEK